MQKTLFGPYFILLLYGYLKFIIASFSCLALSDFLSVYILSLVDLIYIHFIGHHHVMVSLISFSPPKRDDMEPNYLNKKPSSTTY